jgi:hypothetical protein
MVPVRESIGSYFALNLRLRKHCSTSKKLSFVSGTRLLAYLRLELLPPRLKPVLLAPLPLKVSSKINNHAAANCYQP